MVGSLALVACFAACVSRSATVEAIVTPTPTPPPPANSTPQKESNKMSDEYIKAVKSHDESVVERAAKAPEDLAKRLDETSATLDREARELAIELVSRQDGKYAGVFLLHRTDDDDPNVAQLAIEKLAKVVNKPPAADVIAATPSRKDPFVRGELYLYLGKSTETGVLEGLRRLSEKDGPANIRLLAARVKLGGEAERKELVAKVAATAPDDVMEMRDIVVYTGDPKVAKGLVGWLDRDDSITNLGTDRQVKMARMRDLAVWTAHLVGVKLPFETTALRNYTAAEIESTRKLLVTLPD